MASSEDYFVQTRSSSAKNVAHEVVVFDSGLKSRAAKRAEKLSQANKEKEPETIDMKKARFEIYKFAQSGLSSADQQKSKLELAVKLGAKPRKNKGVNYKELLTVRKASLEEANKKNLLTTMRREFELSRKKPETKKSALKRKKRVGDGILNVYGKAKVKTKN